MKEVNVTDFRQHLPSYLAEVGHGVRIILTSRGKPVAELGPPKVPVDQVLDARSILKGSVVRFDDPLVPAADVAEWGALK